MDFQKTSTSKIVRIGNIATNVILFTLCILITSLFIYHLIVL